MAPCDFQRRETVGSGISVSMYRIWQNCGGGFDIVARNGTELERVHARSQRQADETFAMLVGKYGEQRQQASETMYDYQQAEYERMERQDAADLYAWATGR